jgi:hypothetical protein
MLDRYGKGTIKSLKAKAAAPAKTPKKLDLIQLIHHYRKLAREINV